MNLSDVQELLNPILTQYKESFSTKTYAEENDDTDVLMEVFGITPALKRENRQYWGRELGMCWQLLVTTLFRATCENFAPALKVADDEPCDCCVGADAIDTKYRIGSGDSGTLKKFKSYGELLRNQGHRPVLLILREDNLDAALAACKTGGWTVLKGEKTFEYIKEKSGVDLQALLKVYNENGDYKIVR